LHKNHPELPIQEDETAIVVYAARQYQQSSKDVDFIRHLYPRLIAPAGDFMSRFIDDKTSLPHASYDLWEQQFATFTYTVFLTLCGLEAAAEIAESLHKAEDAKRWRDAIKKITAGLKGLRDDNGRYLKCILLTLEGKIEKDSTVDAANFFGAFLYGKADKDALDETVRLIEERLLGSAPIGGVPRYEHDDYFLEDKTKLGNPWMITTLWLARYYISENRQKDALELINWVQERAGDSGMLSEQVDPNTGIGVGVSPLVWSHSTFLETVLKLSD
ncbi:MAG TPA: glycoside hydrolase family 15 protein, partial [Candidatus Saccharimonadales bacterium]|nr:glycoside hydrolase family 15 protein [Candidatus Saccharimonadales bacterium]